MAKTLTGSKQLISQSVVGNVSGYNVYLRMYAWETNTNPSTNKGDINCQLYIYYDAPSSAYTFTTYDGVASTVDFAGQYPFASESLGTTTFTGKQEVLILAKAKSLTHNSDGNYSSTMAGNVTITNWCSGSTSASVNCVTIPRYTTITSFTVTAKSEESVKINWATTDTIDIVYFRYRPSSQSEYTPYLYRNVADGTSGSFTVSSGDEFTDINGNNHTVSFAENTKYYFYLRVRRKDSQQITTSDSTTVTTYATPYCTSAPNFTIGDNLNITVYNPLNRYIDISLKVGNYDISEKINVRGTSFTFNTNSSNIKDSLIRELGNNLKEKAYSIEVYYEGDTVTTTKIKSGSKYYYPNNLKPSILSGEVIDVNSTTIAVTGYSDYIVKGYSTARVKVLDWNTGDDYAQYKSMTTNNTTSTGYYINIANATSASYSTIITNTRNVNSNAVTLTASGGLINYKPLTLKTKFKRPTEVGDEMVLSLNGDYFDDSFVNNPNTLTLKWRVSLDNTNWSNYTTLVLNTDYTISNNSYIGSNIQLTNPFYYQTRDEYFQSGVTYYTEDSPNNYVVYPSSSYNVGDAIPSNLTLYQTGTWDYLTEYYFEAVAIDLLETKTVKQKVNIGQPYFSWWRDNYNEINYFAVNGKLNYGANGREDYDPAGFIYDQYGNMKHKRSTTSDNWSIQDSSGNNAVRVYPETKYVNVYGGLETNSHITIKNASYLKGIDASNNSINLLRATGNRCALGDSTKETRLWSSVIPTVEFGGTVYNIQLSPVSLHDNSSGNTGTISLSQSSAEFTYLEIFFKTNDGDFDSAKVYSPNGKSVSLTTVHNNTSYSWLKTHIYSISGKSFSPAVSAVEARIGNNVATTHSTGNVIYVTKIVGWK